MYYYIEDKAFLKSMRQTCSDIINQLVQQINKGPEMNVQAHLIGSGAKNLITQNEKLPVDLDYNLNMISSKLKNGRDIKEYVRKQFNEVLNANGWGDCLDSTSTLTTKYRHFKKGNKTEFSIDLAITRYYNGGRQRLIHQKTGNACMDPYVWNPVPNSHRLEEKVHFLKSNGLWLELRETYRSKKNMYQKRNDTNHPSFIVYIESVNEVYSKYNPLGISRQSRISLQIRR